MSLIKPSSKLLSEYNTTFARWSNDSAQSVEHIARMSPPQWLIKRPWLHNIAIGTVASIPVIMGVLVIGGAMAFDHGNIILGAIGLGTGVLSLSFAGANDTYLGKATFDWEGWQKQMDTLCGALKTMGLQCNDVEHVVKQILELRHTPINGKQKNCIDKIPVTLNNLIQSYKRENDEYILAQVACSNTTVTVNPPSILDSFGQGAEPKKREWRQRSI